MAALAFHSEDIVFSLPKPRKTAAWIKSVVSSHNYSIESLAIIFCSDKYLHELNLRYLNHDTLTDIITFDNSEVPGVIEGDIFISVDRVRENATRLQLPFQEELHRVIIHGVLHLVGFKDKTKKDTAVMREQENLALALPKVPRETY